jgi:hypothetical protein
VTHPSRTAWHAATNPDELLEVVWPGRFMMPNAPRPPAVVRRMQLFGCACARAVWELVPTDARNAVIVRERFADGRATETDLRAAAPREALRRPDVPAQYAAAAAQCATGLRWEAGHSPKTNWNAWDAARNAAKAVASRTAGPAPPAGHPALKTWQETWNDTFAAARAHQCELLRDIFPPPGYTPALRPDWRTSTVIALARQMDATGDFSAVPILADALQDAGCDDDTILARCRIAGGGSGEPTWGSLVGMGVHCRGNWVVDLVLGRE